MFCKCKGLCLCFMNLGFEALAVTFRFGSVWNFSSVNLTSVMFTLRRGTHPDLCDSISFDGSDLRVPSHDKSTETAER